MQENNTTWIVISDAARARIFQTAEPGQKFTLVKQLAHPESRAQAQDLVSDRPGRIQQSGGPSGHRIGSNPSKGNRSAMEPPTEPKTLEHQIFAREIATELERALHHQEYNHLILAAGPQFLGMLRDTIDKQVSKHVTASLDKDYTHMDVRELQERLSSFMPA